MPAVQVWMRSSFDEHRRVQSHLEGAWGVVKSAHRSLDRATMARRETLLGHLRAYIDSGRYPTNDVVEHATPIFVDGDGTRCAVAGLLEATGRSDVVEYVARTRNLARVWELTSEPAFSEWLEYHGLTAAEAARIQPAYHAHLEPEWRPTASVIAGAHVSDTETVGVEAMMTAGARAGIRRNGRGTDGNGSSQYGSVALAFEYSRAVVVNRGATNQLALVLQWEPTLNVRDAQWYVIGGPLASIDGDNRPGSGFGAELGAGFSFRRRGTVVKDLGVALEPVHVGDDAFVAVEYEVERADDDGFVRVGHETQPWRVFGADGAERAHIAGDRGPNEPAFEVEGGFAIWKGNVCSAFRWGEPEKPSATYPCDDVAPPFVFEGPTAYRARADGRDPVAHLPEVAGASLAQLDPEGVSVFVSLREPDNTQVITFAAADGARLKHDPGDSGGRDFGATWTRAASNAGRACAVASRTGCLKGWSGTCRSDIVDVVCSDAHTERSRRLERTYDEDGNTRGAEQFVVTEDAAFVLWTEAGTLHRLDAHTFEETVLDGAWTFGRREGDLPNVFNRTLRR